MKDNGLAGKIQKYDGRQVRSVWDDEGEEWYFSVVDVVGVLTEQTDYQIARKYWNKLKQRLKEEGSELVTNCHQLKAKRTGGSRFFFGLLGVSRFLWWSGAF